MSAQYLTIEARHRQDIGLLASLADFTLADGEMAGAELVRQPHVSLYCLDDAGRRAIFVELPPAFDLARAPFVYQAQYEQAQRLIGLPYAEFMQQAQALPAIDHLIMVYMTGRCGSTLLSHVFNALGDVISLAEPDVATQFVHVRHTGSLPDAELRGLLDSTVRFLAKPTAAKAPTTAALKLRNEGTRLIDLYQATFPGVKNLYLYRDAVGWVASFYRIFRLAGMPVSIPLDEYLGVFSQMARYDFGQLVRYLDPGTREVSLVEQLTLWWLANIEWYLEKYDQGFPILAVRYDDLNQRREQALAAIFAHCGLPAERIADTLAVFDRDAQAGTLLARERPSQGNQLRLSAAEHDTLTRIVGRHPRIGRPDLVLPGSLPLG